MWRLVSEELRAYRSVLFTSWAFGLGILALVVALLAAVGGAHERREVLSMVGQLPLALLIASMVACFIVTGTERSENRVRMLVMLPLSLRQVALARVLVPVSMMLLGVLVSHAALAVLTALAGAPVAWMGHLRVDFIAAMLLGSVLVVLAAREVIELRKARGWRSALVAKVALIAAVVVLLALQVGQIAFLPAATAGSVAVEAALATYAVRLFCDRADFTK